MDCLGIADEKDKRRRLDSDLSHIGKAVRLPLGPGRGVPIREYPGRPVEVSRGDPAGKLVINRCDQIEDLHHPLPREGGDENNRSKIEELGLILDVEHIATDSLVILGHGVPLIDDDNAGRPLIMGCLLYTSPSPRD